MGSEDLSAKGGVAYRELRTRSLVNRCSVDTMPFEWTVNPYRGCAMGCRYCYAAYTHEFLGVSVPEEFHSVVYVKPGERQRQLARGAPRRASPGTATDPTAGARPRHAALPETARHRGVRRGLHQGRAGAARPDLLRRIHERCGCRCTSR
jgi:hypothetical protein